MSRKPQEHQLYLGKIRLCFMEEDEGDGIAGNKTKLSERVPPPTP